jgi:hypothetical protein
LNSQIATDTAQVNTLTSQVTSLNNQIASLNSQVSSENSQVTSYQSIVSLSVTNTLVNSQKFSVSPPPAGQCNFVPLLPTNYTPKYGGYLLITGTTNSTSSFAFVTFPSPLSETYAYYLGPTVSTPIPITPGNVDVHLDNCGTTTMSATLTVTEVT